MEGHEGEAPKNVRIYNLEQTRLIDTELTKHATISMDRQTKAKKTVLRLRPYTQPHNADDPVPDFQNKTHNGDFADVLAEIDAHVGQLLDAVDKLWNAHQHESSSSRPITGPEFSTDTMVSAGLGTAPTSRPGSLIARVFHYPMAGKCPPRRST